MNTRAVSDDGSTVVFSTSGALSPRAVNDLQSQSSPPVDVYEWHEGAVSLISTGHSLTSDEQATVRRRVVIFSLCRPKVFCRRTVTGWRVSTMRGLVVVSLRFQFRRVVVRVIRVRVRRVCRRCSVKAGARRSLAWGTCRHPHRPPWAPQRGSGSIAGRAM